VNLAFVRYFVGVVETAGFTAAAERCHVTQPTLSAGIARLEEEIGARLFERGRRVALTAAGQRFLPHARAMLESWQAARAESRATRRAKLVRVAIASTLPIDAAMRWLAAAEIDVEISEGTSGTVEERWQRGRCDVALFATRGAVPRSNATSLFREAFLLAASNDHLVATRDRWSVRELADTPFVLRGACEAHEEATRLFAAEGAKPRAVMRSADEERCAAAVLAGLGVCLMPRSLLRPGMASAEIREVALERRVVLAWHEGVELALIEAATGHPWPGKAGVGEVIVR